MFCTAVDALHWSCAAAEQALKEQPKASQLVFTEDSDDGTRRDSSALPGGMEDGRAKMAGSVDGGTDGSAAEEMDGTDGVANSSLISPFATEI